MTTLILVVVAAAVGALAGFLLAVVLNYEPPPPRKPGEGYRLDDVTIRVVDVVAEGVAAYGREQAEYLAGRALPDHEYRLELHAVRPMSSIRVTYPVGHLLSAEQVLSELNYQPPEEQ